MPLSAHQIVESVLPELQKTLAAGNVIPEAAGSDPNSLVNFDADNAKPYEPIAVLPEAEVAAAVVTPTTAPI